MKRDAMRLHADDDVAVALRPLKVGDTVSIDGIRVTLRADIPLAHKFALKPITAGRPVRKYGEAIGEARAAISAGDHVHVHNIVSRRARQAP